MWFFSGLMVLWTFWVSWKNILSPTDIKIFTWESKISFVKHISWTRNIIYIYVLVGGLMSKLDCRNSSTHSGHLSSRWRWCVKSILLYSGWLQQAAFHVYLVYPSILQNPFTFSKQPYTPFPKRLSKMLILQQNSFQKESNRLCTW